MSSYKELGYKGIKYELIDSLLELSLSEQLDIIKVVLCNAEVDKLDNIKDMIIDYEMAVKYG